MNNYYEDCFNIVCDDWEENHPELYEMVFEPVYYCRSKHVEEYKYHFIYDVANAILKNKPFVGNVSMTVIEKLIDEKRHKIIWDKHYAVINDDIYGSYSEDSDSDYNSDSDYEYLNFNF